MSRTHEKLRRFSAKANLHLRTPDGEFQGPFQLAALAERSARNLLPPGSDVSDDGATWVPASEIPELKMDWTARIEGGGDYGPFNLFAVPALVENGTIPWNATLLHKTTGHTLPVQQVLRADSGPDGEVHGVPAEKRAEWETRYYAEKKLRLEHEVGLSQQVEQLEFALDESTLSLQHTVEELKTERRKRTDIRSEAEKALERLEARLVDALRLRDQLDHELTEQRAASASLNAQVAKLREELGAQKVRAAEVDRKNKEAIDRLSAEARQSKQEAERLAQLAEETRSALAAAKAQGAPAEQSERDRRAQLQRRLEELETEARSAAARADDERRQLAESLRKADEERGAAQRMLMEREAELERRCLELAQRLNGAERTSGEQARLAEEAAGRVRHEESLRLDAEKRAHASEENSARIAADLERERNAATERSKELEQSLAALSQREQEVAALKVESQGSAKSSARELDLKRSLEELEAKTRTAAERAESERRQLAESLRKAGEEREAARRMLQKRETELERRCQELTQQLGAAEKRAQTGGESATRAAAELERERNAATERAKELEQALAALSQREQEVATLKAGSQDAAKSAARELDLKRSLEELEAKTRTAAERAEAERRQLAESLRKAGEEREAARRMLQKRESEIAAAATGSQPQGVGTGRGQAVLRWGGAAVLVVVAFLGGRALHRPVATSDVTGPAHPSGPASDVPRPTERPSTAQTNAAVAVRPQPAHPSPVQPSVARPPQQPGVVQVRWPEMKVERVTVVPAKDSRSLVFSYGVFTYLTIMRDEAKYDLRRVADAIRNSTSDVAVVVVGHTDSVPMSPGGPYPDNRALATARAVTVVNFLADQCGLPRGCLTAVAAGDGNSAPYPEADPESAKKNRTVVLKLAPRRR